ncbi:hypothetical protein HAL_39680 [Haladaptatus sp. T7]|nr:hypothetical protein HAL_39680 [Haladaptatus sp. T7]
MGTSKAKNKRTVGGFHDWSRANLPERFKKQDLDIVLTSDGVKPQYLIELQRSYIDLDRWAPFKDDLRNYVKLRIAGKECDRIRCRPTDRLSEQRNDWR